MNRQQLEKAAVKLAQRFYADCQALFDDPGMTDEIASGEVFENLCSAQSAADDVIEAAK